MNRHHVLAVMLLLGAASFAPEQVFAQVSACNRACLADALDRYLNAVVEHDPEAAGLATGFRQTENAVVVARGAGMWQSAVGLGDVQRRFFDPATGNAVFFGIVEERTGPAIVMLRVRADRRQITEAEWYVGRRGDPGINGPVDADGDGGNLYDVDNLIANPPLERSVPDRARLPRDTLVAIADSYFDGLTNHDGDIILAHPGCRRVENGVQTTGRPLPEERPNDGYQGRTDCTSNMGTFNIALVAGRRYTMVDEEAQVVLGTVVFVRNPGATQRRNGLSELFFIDDALIREIQAAMFYPAPAQPLPNWPPYDGNFPLPAAIGANP
jgi:hypothetical protein